MPTGYVKSITTISGAEGIICTVPDNVHNNGSIVGRIMLLHLSTQQCGFAGAECLMSLQSKREGRGTLFVQLKILIIKYDRRLTRNQITTWCEVQIMLQCFELNALDDTGLIIIIVCYIAYKHFFSKRCSIVRCTRNTHIHVNDNLDISIKMIE